MAKPFAYYNEFDKNAVAWLRELIKCGLIMDGEVDDRSIIDVQANDLRGFTRHHFFAGISGWDYALQLAGWPIDRPVVTASLPCQPFSAAGKQLGKADERHLLPHFLNLVKQCNFQTIFGEQVPAAVRHGWLDDLCDEMERENYAVGSIVLTAAGQGGPHIRQRLYWVADSKRIASIKRCESAMQRGRSGNTEQVRVGCSVSELWANPDWIYCRDEKYRPIKPGIEPLVNWPAGKLVHSGDTSEPINANNTQEARVMRLKGYGNAICAPVAASFIKAFMDVENG